MKVVIIGFGGAGRASVAEHLKRGDQVRIGHYRHPPRLPSDAEFVICDVLNPEQVNAACAGMDAAIFSAAFPYFSKVWERDFPVAMANMINACAKTGARLVFVDNLYLYGPQTEPLRADMPLTEFGRKPKLRAQITQQWIDANRLGRIRGVAVRASDYYGPDPYGPLAPPSVFGLFGVERMMAGKPAMLIHAPDIAHDFTYVPDFARAVATLAHAPDDAYGRGWHVPNAPVQTPRELFQIIADLMGVKLKLMALPEWLLSAAGPLNPLMAEAAEMKFQRDRPYLVDATDFSARFWADATPFENGLQATIEYYRTAATSAAA